jgi:hypothetical protein
MRAKSMEKSTPGSAKSINQNCQHSLSTRSKKQWFIAAELLPQYLPNTTSFWTVFKDDVGSTGTKHLEIEDMVMFRHSHVCLAQGITFGLVTATTVTAMEVLSQLQWQLLKTDLC